MILFYQKLRRDETHNSRIRSVPGKEPRGIRNCGVMAVTWVRRPHSEQSLQKTKLKTVAGGKRKMGLDPPAASG